MKKQKLLKLAELLDRVPPEQFDMGVIATRDPGTRCASTACALGWATTIFDDLRLAPVVSKATGEVMEDSAEVVHAPTGKQSVDAACEAFGLDRCDVWALFYDDWFAEPHEIASKIRRLVHER